MSRRWRAITGQFCFVLLNIIYIKSLQAVHVGELGFSGQCGIGKYGRSRDAIGKAYSKRGYMYRAMVSVQFHVYISYWLGTRVWMNTEDFSSA
jgi:hypothetical protein